MLKKLKNLANQIEMFDQIERMLEPRVAQAAHGSDRIERRYVQALLLVLAAKSAALEMRANVRGQLDVVLKNEAANITLVKKKAQNKRFIKFFFIRLKKSKF